MNVGRSTYSDVRFLLQRDLNGNLDLVHGRSRTHTEIFEQRQERFNPEKYKAAIMVRQNVVEMVQGQLNVQWTAYQMMEHLSATYGGTTAVNITITEDDDPTDVVAKIQKMYQDMEEICRTKDVTTIEKLLQVQCNHPIIRNLDISPYSNLRDHLITGDIVNLSLDTT
ncbi:hypothetical protein SeLEV6574_g03169 [Synchytrium endobioticum]|uniref:Uncharacterized protein n=1 Tax=Synchytrium endobioticum TaxID=286115 RepID=A0A507D5S9_9FUNG|nr:hypothetical protein SeLEV6574_g03169 [Synchytrium endobioticum]